MKFFLVLLSTKLTPVSGIKILGTGLFLQALIVGNKDVLSLSPARCE